MLNRVLDSKLSGYLIVISLLVMWELSSRFGLISARFLPAVSTVCFSFVNLLISFELVHHLLVSTIRILSGFLIGSLFGYILGFACGLSKGTYSLLEMSIEFLRPIPSVILIPIAILLLGIGDALNIGVIAWACSWPVFINTMDGVRSVDNSLVNTGRVFGLDDWAIVRKIYAAASLPQVFSGLRISLGIAVAVGVNTEMVASGSGIGSFILSTSLSSRVPEMYAGIVAVGLLGTFFNRVFLLLEWRALKWNKQPSAFAE